MYIVTVDDKNTGTWVWTYETKAEVDEYLRDGSVYESKFGESMTWSTATEGQICSENGELVAAVVVVQVKPSLAIALRSQ